jgi:RNA polymerase sigma factor (sigma-70 family)
MGKETEKAWEDFVRLKNEESFRVLYKHYFGYLTYIAYKKQIFPARVGDTINDLFLYLWESRDRLGSVDNFHNYIVTIFLRKLYRKDDIGEVEDVDPELRPELFVLPSVEAQYIHFQGQRNLSSTVERFVRELPEKQRRMVYQKFFLGLSYQEIADINNVSINTVYNTIYKAIDKLRGLMGKEYRDSLFFLFFL